jgi:hypothetical protein
VECGKIPRQPRSLGLAVRRRFWHPTRELRCLASTGATCDALEVPSPGEANVLSVGIGGAFDELGEGLPRWEALKMEGALTAAGRSICWARNGKGSSTSTCLARRGIGRTPRPGQTTTIGRTGTWSCAAMCPCNTIASRRGSKCREGYRSRVQSPSSTMANGGAIAGMNVPVDGGSR